MKKNTKIRIAVFFLELLCLAILIGGLYIYRRATVSLQKIEQPEFHEEEITVNAEAPQMKGFSTYAIFGTDHRVLNSEMEGENSDTIIIACVNNSTKEVRLASVYRDTLLDMVWGADFDGSDRVVDNHIKKLRQALGSHGNSIKTVIGRGYKIVP